jgi:hypothetical protein
MSYLAYLYDTTGELWRVEEAETAEPLVCTMTEVDGQEVMDRTFALRECGLTVRGEPRLIYYEGHPCQAR